MVSPVVLDAQRKDRLQKGEGDDPKHANFGEHAWIHVNHGEFADASDCNAVVVEQVGAKADEAEWVVVPDKAAIETDEAGCQFLALTAFIHDEKDDEAAIDAALVFRQSQLRQFLKGVMAMSPQVADRVHYQVAAILSAQEDAEEELAAGGQESAGAAAADPPSPVPNVPPIRPKVPRTPTEAEARGHFGCPLHKDCAQYCKQCEEICNTREAERITKCPRKEGRKNDQLPWDMTEPRLEAGEQVCDNLAAVHGLTMAVSSKGKKLCRRYDEEEDAKADAKALQESPTSTAATFQGHFGCPRHIECDARPETKPAADSRAKSSEEETTPVSGARLRYFAETDKAIIQAMRSGFPEWKTMGQGGNEPNRTLHKFWEHSLKEGARIGLYMGLAEDDLENAIWADWLKSLPEYDTKLRQIWGKLSPCSEGNAVEMIAGISYTAFRNNTNLPESQKLVFNDDNNSKEAWIRVWEGMKRLGLQVSDTAGIELWPQV